MPSSVSNVLSRIASFQSVPAGAAPFQAKFSAALQQRGATIAAARVAEASQNVLADATGVGTADSTSVLGTTALGGSAPTDAPTGSSDVAAAAPDGNWRARLPAAGLPYADLIEETAARHGLQPEFLAAALWTESSFNPSVVSEAGAIGLGQLMPATAAWLGVDPWNPAQNMEGAATYYRNLIDRFSGDESLGVASYFAGPGAVGRAGAIPTSRAQNYVDKVLGRRDFLLGVRPTAP
ncbi:MAG: lytic transglycosylase domain-containing protein [Ilumatobacteraceae bacterium]